MPRGTLPGLRAGRFQKGVIYSFCHRRKEKAVQYGQRIRSQVASEPWKGCGLPHLSIRHHPQRGQARETPGVLHFKDRSVGEDNRARPAGFQGACGAVHGTGASVPAHQKAVRHQEEPAAEGDQVPEAQVG